MTTAQALDNNQNRTGVLTTRRAVVTGAGGGIGEGIVAMLREAGALVVAADRDPAAAEMVAGRYGAVALTVDVTSEESVVALERAASEALGGPIDLLVNSAGLASTSLVVDLPVAEWDRIMNVNARGTFLCCKIFGRRMLSGDGPRTLINIASIAGRRGTAEFSHYAASKFAVIGLTQAVADEFASYGITVNAICPGHVRSGMIDSLCESAGVPLEAWTADQLIKKPQDATDIGQAAVYLATAKNVTGQSLNVDGGWYLA